MSNKYSDALYDAFETMFDVKIQNMDNVLTIEAYIIELLSTSTRNLYSAKYYDETIQIYGHENEIYEKGDKVTVIVPNGDFTKDKFIIGKIEEEQDDKDDDTDYDKVVYNKLYTIYEHKDGYQFKSNEEKNYDNHKIQNSDIAKILSDLINNKNKRVGITNVIGITAKFELDIPDAKQHQPGNYGIRFNLPAIQNKQDIIWSDCFSAILDSQSQDNQLVYGNPYTASGSQTVYFKLNEDVVYDENKYGDNIKIQYFCKDFDINDTEEISIKLSDIDISVYEMIDFSIITDKYFLLLKSKDVNYFSNTAGYTDNKIITPYLYVDGKLTQISENYTYSWYRLDFKNNSNGKEVISKDKTLEVSKKDVVLSTIYGCDLTRNDNNNLFTINNTIEIFNLDSKYTSLELIKDGRFIKTKNTPFLLKANCVSKEDYKNNESINFYWGYENNQGLSLELFLQYSSSIKINNNTYSDVKNLTSANVANNCVIYVTAYHRNTEDEVGIETYIGTKHIYLIEEEDNSRYHIVIKGGNALWTYDINGSSPFSPDNSDGYLRDNLKIEPITFSILERTDTGYQEILNDKYINCKTTWTLPNNQRSLMDFSDSGITNSWGVFDDNGDYILEKRGKSCLYYKIDNKFDYNKSLAGNNVIKLTLEYDGEIFENFIQIMFAKDGGIGTNGTGYAAAILYQGYPYDAKYNGMTAKIIYVSKKGSGGVFYDYKTGGSLNNAPIDIKVYKNGKECEKDEYEVKFDIIGNEDKNKVFFIEENKEQPGSYSLRCENDQNIEQRYIISAEVKYKMLGKENNTLLEKSLHTFYPIEICIIPNGFELKNNDTIFPYIEEGFFNVDYSDQGFNPTFNNSKDFTWNLTGLVNFEKGSEMTKNLSAEFNIDKDSNLTKINGKIVPKSEIDLIAASKDYVTGTFKYNYENADVFNDVFKTKKIIKYYEDFENDYLNTRINRQKDATDSNSDYDTIFSDFTKYVNEKVLKYLEIKRQLITDINAFNEIQKELYNFFIALDWEDSVNSANKRYIKKPEGTNNEITVKTYIKSRLKEMIVYDYQELAEIIFEDTTFIYNIDNILKYKLDGIQPILKLFYLKGITIENAEKFGNRAYENGWLTKGGKEEYNKIINKHKNTKQLNIDIDGYVNYKEGLESFNTLKDLKDIMEKAYADLKNPKIPDNEYESQYPIYTNYKKEMDRIIQKYLYNAEEGLLEVFDKDFAYNSILIKEITENNQIKYTYNINNSYYEEDKKELQALLINQENDAIGKIKQGQDSHKFTYYKPILCRKNVYGNSHINNWDGLSVYTDGKSLSAPMLAAGQKDKDNTFRGIILGEVEEQIGEPDSRRIGLAAYGGYRDKEDIIKKIGQIGGLEEKEIEEVAKSAEGAVGETFFLDADTGSLRIGASGGGQIIIDPDLYSLYEESDGKKIIKRSIKRSPKIFSNDYFKRKEDGQIDYEHIYDNEIIDNGKVSTYGSPESTGLLIDLGEPFIQMKNKGRVVFHVDKNGMYSSPYTDADETPPDVIPEINPDATSFIDNLHYNYKSINNDKTIFTCEEKANYHFYNTNDITYYFISNDSNDIIINNLTSNKNYYKTSTNQFYMQQATWGEHYYIYVKKDEVNKKYLILDRDKMILSDTEWEIGTHFYYDIYLKETLRFTEEHPKCNKAKIYFYIFTGESNKTLINLPQQKGNGILDSYTLEPKKTPIYIEYDYTSDVYIATIENNGIFYLLDSGGPGLSGWITKPYLYCSESLVDSKLKVKDTGFGVALMSKNPGQGNTSEVFDGFSLTKPDGKKTLSTYDRQLNNSVLVAPAGISLGKRTFLSSSGEIRIGNPQNQKTQWIFNYTDNADTIQGSVKINGGYIAYGVTFEDAKELDGGVLEPEKVVFDDDSILLSPQYFQYGKNFVLEQNKAMHFGERQNAKKEKLKHWGFNFSNNTQGGLIYGTDSDIEKTFKDFKKKYVGDAINDEGRMFIGSKGVYLSKLFFLEKNADNSDKISMGTIDGVSFEIKSYGEETSFQTKFEEASGDIPTTAKTYTPYDDTEYDRDVSFGTLGIRFGNIFKVYRRAEEEEKEEGKTNFVGQISDLFQIINSHEDDKPRLMTIKDYIDAYGGGGGGGGSNLPPAESAYF